MMRSLLLLLVLVSVFSCSKPDLPRSIIQFSDKTYLALGDSYTVGDAVYQKESFPFQLVDQLNAAGIKTSDPDVVAYTGWTTSNLIDGIKQAKLKEKYDFVTLLIGVNNQYMKFSKETYRKEFAELLNTAISHSAGGRATVFVISIPDWGVTPFGQLKNPVEVTIEIDAFNKINREEAFNARVHYIDITPGSRLAENDQSLTSADSLHPSGKMYAEWVKQLLPMVKKELY
ncbi:SGNH/GDSL hydrolase family protein [Daejeonella rubra]|nr:SGNH/GDSL hydrolase family protein [Daejeonella rubra]